MPSRKTKASAFQAPEKFNFLTGGKPPRPQFVFLSGSVEIFKPDTRDRRFWPLGCTPDDARREIADLKVDLKKMIRGDSK